MIQPTSNNYGFNRTDAIASAAAKAAAAQPPPSENVDRLSRSNSDALRTALSNNSEIRPEVVARGHSLAVDPNYPPREIIDQLAKMILASRDLTEQA